MINTFSGYDLFIELFEASSISILCITVVPILFLSQLGQAQVISGIVLDKETGEPLSSVNVFISQSTIGTYTDDDGTFRFTTKLSGVHTLVFSYVGFVTDAREINLRNDQDLGLNLNPNYSS